MDDAALNTALPLQVLPQPRELHRLGLVICRNIDPFRAELIDALIGQLGDTDWHRREAAQQQLARFGSAAVTQLRAATGNPDPEIAIRAEQLLSAGTFTQPAR
jgi:hypothetical protein